MRIFGLTPETYEVIGVTEDFAKQGMAAADYTITKEMRKNDQYQVLEDGEEIGQSLTPRGIWHTSMLSSSP